MKKVLIHGRGQAAMEFLTTYGWAILIIVIVLAALIWMGVFNTNQALADRCTFGSGFYCDSLQLRAIDNAGQYRVHIGTLNLRNNLGERIKMCGFQFRTGSTPLNIPTAAACASGAGYFISPSDTLKFAGGNFKAASFGSSGPLPLLITIPPLPVMDFWKALNFCREGDTDDAYLVAGPGQMVEANLFVFYVTESDTGSGNARIAKGVIVARAN